MKIMLFAEKGMVLTDGKNYGEAISLADDRNPEEYHEITKEEYDEIMAAQECLNEGCV